MRWFRYFAGPIVLGLAIAALVLWRLPPQVAEPRDSTPDAPQQTLESLAEERVSYADAVRRAAPSVVNIYTRKLLPERRHPLLNDPFYRRFFDRSAQHQQQRMESSLGSGVIVSGEGYILTNAHVIAGADAVIVLLADGREAQATVVGADGETDLAVLKIVLDGLAPIPVGNSSQARVGDVVLAIGNPFGLGQSVSQGIISALGRGIGLNTYENFLQTDAAINRGNSGGALIDAYGNLIGINTAMLDSGTSQGISFAIPVKTAIKVLGDIVRHGQVIRGWLGVNVQQLPTETAQALGLSPPSGLVVQEIQPGGPAATAGLLAGDVITHINGAPALDAAYSINLIADLKPGTQMRLQVLRGNAPVAIVATVGTRPVN
ncbi:MAG TPA: trypsin-like peptidase domain-containing protein [Porticoccaceae bacterium]|nr:trypsin-like peptidase domain-containing protein [Porticoccaceae bacterium]